MCYENKPVHEETYRGHKIKILHDMNGESADPYDGDGMYPMIVVPCGRNTREHDYHDLGDQLIGAMQGMTLPDLIALAGKLGSVSLSIRGHAYR